jgi:hypothetical protein
MIDHLPERVKNPRSPARVTIQDRLGLVHLVLVLDPGQDMVLGKVEWMDHTTTETGHGMHPCQEVSPMLRTWTGYRRMAELGMLTVGENVLTRRDRDKIWK